MEDLVSPTHSIQIDCKFVTRLEKLKKLFDTSVDRRDQQHIILQQSKNTTYVWADIQISYKQLEKAHNEFNITNIGKQKKMDYLEFDLLRIIVGLYCEVHQLQPLQMNVYDWDQIGQILFNRHWKVCRSKWIESQATSIVDHPWSREEDAILSQLYDKYAEQNKTNKWSLIAMDMSKICNSSHVRLGKQCRERWINKLNPQVERSMVLLNQYQDTVFLYLKYSYYLTDNNISDSNQYSIQILQYYLFINLIQQYKEDEIKLLVAVLKHGKKWSQISRKEFNTLRTENCLKNRFHTILKRESTRYEINQTQSKKQILSNLKLEDESKLIENIIQELREESKLQHQSDLSDRIEKKYKLVQTDQLLDFANNNFQIAIIKKNKLNILF